MASQCKNRMNNNGPSFTGQYFKCNKYGHKENVCRSVMNKFQNRINVRFYACGILGHVSNQCKSRRNQMNFMPRQGNVVFYACNKSGHIAKYCRRRNVNRSGPEDKNKNVKEDEKGKEKVEEIRDQIKKKWVKSNSKVGNGFAPDSSARMSSGN